MIFYANGWRLDFKKFRIVRIGGIFLKDFPADAELKINGGLTDGSFKKFLSGTLVNNLLPGDYSLAIEKDGYYSWGKTVGVEPATVAEMKVVLIPRESKPVVLDSRVRDFWINESTLIYLDSNWQYFLADINDLKSRANLGTLFNKLKERALNLPGFVPIIGVEKQESPSRWLIKTARAQYLLDSRKLTLELLKEEAQAPEVAAEEETILSEFENKYQPNDSGITKYIYSDSKIYLLRAGKLFFLDIQ